MRVGMIAYAYYEGNARVQQYVKALVERGDTVEIFCLSSDGPSASEIAGAKIHRIQARKRRRESPLRYALSVTLFMLRTFFILAKQQLQNPYDVIHVHSVPDALVFSALVPKLAGVPIVLDIHDILPEFYLSKFQAKPASLTFKLLVLVEKASIAFSNHVIIANPIWHERLLQRSAGPDKVTTIRNYPDPKVFSPRPERCSNGKFIMIYPGSLNWHQGLDIAIQAFAKIVGEIPDAEFWIYGEGPERDNLIQLASSLGVQAKVSFRDFLPVTKLVEVLAGSDLAIVPKRSSSVFGTEAASTKIMEFMAVGIPVIVSRTKIDSLYHDDSMVQFFDSDDPDNLARAILHLYKNPGLRRQLTANALAYVAENRWETKKGEYLAIVDRLVDCSRRRDNTTKRSSGRGRNGADATQ